MNILFVTEANPDRDGSGWQRRAAQHLCALTRVGKVTVVLPNPDANEPDLSAKPRVIALGAADVIIRETLSLAEETYRAEAQAESRFSKIFAKLRRSPWLDGRAQRGDREHYRGLIAGKYDVIFAFRLQSGLWIDSILRPRDRAKIMILDFDDIESNKFQDMRKNNDFSFLGKLKLKQQSRWITSVERRFCENWTAISICSEVDAKRIMEKYKSPACVIPNGYVFGAMLPAAKGRQGKILFVGNFAFNANAQGASWFIEQIWPLIRHSLGNGVSATFAGFKPPQSILALDELPGISIVPNAPNLVELYANADVVIAPILSGSGTRTKLIEAAAFGRAIVTTSIGCEGLGFIDGVHAEIADSPADFAYKLQRLLENPEERFELAVNCYNYTLANFNSENIEIFLADKIRSLVSKRNSLEVEA